MNEQYKDHYKMEMVEHLMRARLYAESLGLWNVVGQIEKIENEV